MLFDFASIANVRKTIEGNERDQCQKRISGDLTRPLPWHANLHFGFQLLFLMNLHYDHSFVCTDTLPIIELLHIGGLGGLIWLVRRAWCAFGRGEAAWTHDDRCLYRFASRQV